VNTVAKMILNDWLRGKIPFFVPPPEDPLQSNNNDNKETNSKLAIIAPKQKISTIRVREEFKEIDKDRMTDDDVISTSDIEDDVNPNGDNDDVKWEDVVETTTNEIK